MWWKFLTDSLVVHVGLSSLGGHVDDDTDMSLVFWQAHLKKTHFYWFNIGLINWKPRCHRYLWQWSRRWRMPSWDRPSFWMVRALQTDILSSKSQIHHWKLFPFPKLHRNIEVRHWEIHFLDCTNIDDQIWQHDEGVWILSDKKGGIIIQKFDCIPSHLSQIPKHQLTALKPKF